MKLLTSLFLCLAACGLAPAQTFQFLGTPCRAFNVLASRAIKAPDGNEYFVLSNTNEISGVELIFIDYKNNTARTYKAPAGQGAWSLSLVPGDRLVVGTYYDGKFMVFDLKSMSFTKVIPFPGEEYFWNAAIGSDGRLYGGTYPGAKLGALDLNALTIEDCGAPAPPNLYLRNISALPDGRILANFVTSDPKSKIYDPQTKKWSDPPEHFKHVQRGVTWNNHFLAGGSWDGKATAKGAIAFKSDLTPVNPPPFALPPDDGNTWAVDLNLTSADTLVLHRGNARFRYFAAERSSAGSTPNLEKIFDQNLHGGAITAMASDGTLLGIRGQDYLIAKPGSLKADLKPIPTESSPRPIHFIKPDENGKLWGGPVFGQTIFHIDLATKKVTNTSTVSNHGGEVYDAAFLNNKTYLVAYAGGDIIEYDATQPWNQLDNKNPRTIAHLGDRGYIRPVGGVQVGDDGKLYSGWMAKYGTYGGAIAITDPAMGKTDLIENPLGEQAVYSVALDENHLYVSTSLDGNGLPNKPNAEPQFGMLDRATRKVLFQQPIGVSRILIDAKTKKVLIVSGSKLRTFDPASKTLTDVPSAPPVTHQAIECLGDGTVWYASGNKLIHLNLTTNEVKSFIAPIAIEHLGISKTHAFISSGPSIFSLELPK